MGDALLQKPFTVDFLTKKRVINNGIAPQYYVENNHEPIIPREIFMQVQEELTKRRSVHTTQNGKKRNYSNNNPLSQIVFCGNCGEIFRRVHWYNKYEKLIVWRCTSRLENTGSFCDASTVGEDDLKDSMLKAINMTLGKKDSFITTLKNNIATVLNEENDETLDSIDVKLEDLQIELLRLANSKTEYDGVANEIHRLRDLRQNSMIKNAERQGQRQRTAEMEEFLNEQSGFILTFDEQLIRRLIEKITVFDGHLTVEFKSGIEIYVEL